MKSPARVVERFRIRRGVLVLVSVCLLGLVQCAVKKTERLPRERVLTLETASLDALLERVRLQADAVRSLQATTELIPSTGSDYSGVIEQYHDVRAFLLAERQQTAGGNSRRIRMIGQAPIVRKNIFDMMANEHEFRIFVPPKNKFVVGPTTHNRRSDKPIENLRPQHLFDALFFDPPDPSTVHVLEENEFGGRRFYAVSELLFAPDRPVALARKWWFDRSDLALVRVQRFDAAGRLLADVHYGEWASFDGISYPKMIELVRPPEDYRLKFKIKELTLNQPIPPEKFQLEKPPGAELVELKENEDTAAVVDLGEQELRP